MHGLLNRGWERGNGYGILGLRDELVDIRSSRRVNEGWHFCIR